MPLIPLLFLAIPSATFAACFVICTLRTHTEWSSIHWATVCLGGTFFVWIMPVTFTVAASLGLVVEQVSGTTIVIAGVSLASIAMAILLGLATSSAAVAVFTGIAGAIACLLFLRSDGSPMSEDFLTAAQAVVAWQVVVCTSLFAWMRSTLRNKPWLGKPMFCRKCGYDLSGSPTPVCPECGTNLINRKTPGTRRAQ